VPKGLDTWIPWRELLKSAPADANLQSGQTRALSLANSLDEGIVLALTSEHLAES
jgi:hypothetical protein